MSRTVFALLPVLLLFGLLASCAPEGREPQLEALARWEDQRLAPVDSLVAMIEDPDAFVRRAALRTAGLIGRTDALPAMISALDDRSQAVRGQAAFSLGLLGGSVAVEPLTAALADPHVATRVAAIQGLAHQDHDGSMLYEPALRGETREARAAWTALRNVAGEADPDSLVAAVRAGLTRSEPGVRWRVLRCAERAADSTLVSQIAPYATDRDVQIRVHALRALARQTGPAALEAVLRSGERHGRLRGRDLNRVQVAEMRALGRLAGPVLAADGEGEHTSPAGRAAAMLIRGAVGEDPFVAETALAAMAAATRDLDLPREAATQESLLAVWRIRMVRAARQRLGAAEPAVRAAACAALGSLRRDGARPELEAVIEDGDASVAAAALSALVRLLPDGATLDRYRDLAFARTAPVKVGLLSGLDEVLPADDAAFTGGAFAAAAAGIDDADFTVRTTAAGLLSHFPGGPACAHLTRVLDRAGAPADVRLAALGALGRLFVAIDDGTVAADSLDTGAVAAGLRRAFDDPDLRVRLAARECAVETGLLPDDLIPAAASLRETMPAFRRDPAQPPVTRPFEAPEVRCLTDHGVFTIRLDTGIAPNTCAAFLALIADGFHEDLAFHRVVPDFVVQAGCPRDDGWGDPGWTIRSEWSREPFERGTVGIAHSGKDTGGSQWFVCHSAQPHLDGRYTVFGHVTGGMDVVDRIQRGDRYRFEVVGP